MALTAGTASMTTMATAATAKRADYAEGGIPDGQYDHDGHGGHGSRRDPGRDTRVVLPGRFDTDTTPCIVDRRNRPADTARHPDEQKQAGTT